MIQSILSMLGDKKCHQRQDNDNRDKRPHAVSDKCVIGDFLIVNFHAHGDLPLWFSSGPVPEFDDSIAQQQPCAKTESRRKPGFILNV